MITLDDARVPYTHKATIGFQQQIGNTMSFQADYVFQGFRNGRYQWNENLTYDPATGVNRPYSDPSTRRWPDMGLVHVFEHGKTAKYHGLEMAFTKRFDQGYQLSATYTVWESTSCSPSPVDGAFPVARDLGDDCWFSTISDAGPSHQRHRAVFNGIVDLAYDFQLSGLYFFGSGQRYDSYLVADHRDTGGFFIPWPASASRLEADGTIIDAGAVKGDPIHRVDVRLMRRFNLGQARIDGIVEVFNLFNHVNYGNYQGCTCAPNYAEPLFNADVAYLPRLAQGRAALHPPTQPRDCRLREGARPGRRVSPPGPHQAANDAESLRAGARNAVAGTERGDRWAIRLVTSSTSRGPTKTDLAP